MTLSNLMATIQLAADRAGYTFFLYSETPKTTPVCGHPDHAHLTFDSLEIEVVYLRPDDQPLAARIDVPQALLDSLGIDEVRGTFGEQIARWGAERQ